MKHEWRKKEKELYIPKAQPTFLEVPEFKYITIKGEGNPNSEFFSTCVEALYGVAYGIRMSYKWPTPPIGYYEYTVYPLEGIWDLIDPSKHDDNDLDKDNLKFELMIRQPDFVDEALFNQALESIRKKKNLEQYSNVVFKTIQEGPSIQMLHLGSYDNERKTFDIMEAYCHEHGYSRLKKTHKEIYLTNPQKTAPEKLKTTLRFQIK